MTEKNIPRANPHGGEAETTDTPASVKSAAQDAMDAARGEVAARAEASKETVASGVSDVAAALRTAAGELRSGSPQERTLGQIAETLADASSAIRDKDLGEAAHDLSAFARRNPLIFLGGAALVGFAVTRFARASADRGAGSMGYDRPSSEPSSEPSSLPPMASGTKPAGTAAVTSGNPAGAVR